MNSTYKPYTLQEFSNSECATTHTNTLHNSDIFVSLMIINSCVCVCVCVQVLCKESIWASRCYWEVLYSGWVVIGVTYEGAGRRAGDGPCGLGENEESWGLGWAGSCYDAWHKGINSRVEDADQCCTIGVYVDQPAGLLCFYAVETERDSQKKQVKLLHRFKNSIKEKILPGFWVGRQSSCLILKKEE